MLVYTASGTGLQGLIFWENNLIKSSDQTFHFVRQVIIITIEKETTG